MLRNRGIQSCSGYVWKKNSEMSLSSHSQWVTFSSHTIECRSWWSYFSGPCVRAHKTATSLESLSVSLFSLLFFLFVCLFGLKKHWLFDRDWKKEKFTYTHTHGCCWVWAVPTAHFCFAFFHSYHISSLITLDFSKPLWKGSILTYWKILKQPLQFFLW